jgi:hypothetical protein
MTISPSTPSERRIEMTVQEWFEAENIQRQDIEAMADESDYSESASQFICQRWDADVEDLSPKQAAWASRILDDMVDRRIQGRRRW